MKRITDRYVVEYGVIKKNRSIRGGFNHRRTIEIVQLRHGARLMDLRKVTITYVKSNIGETWKSMEQDLRSIVFSFRQFTVKVTKQETTYGFHVLFYFSMCEYTYSEFLSIYGDNSRMNDFLVDNASSHLCNINFSALGLK